MNHRHFLTLAPLTLALALAGCGGGSSGSAPPAPPTPKSYSVSGTVTGLPSGNFVTLQDNGGDDLTLSGTGSAQNFTFPTKLLSGASYAVSVSAQPTGMKCFVRNGSGTMGGSNVTGIGVTCAAISFAYVANNGSNSVSAFSIDAAGALTPVAGSPFATGQGGASSVTVTPAGSFAYVANYGSNSVSAFSIDASTGALTPVVGSPFVTGMNPRSVVVAQP